MQPPPILVRPRLTDCHGLSLTQAQADFAIPFLDEDIPLYVDPFLLWKSPSQQDQALHTSIVNSFNHLNWLLKRGDRTAAEDILITASECAEVGLGHSRTRKGLRIGRPKAQEILSLFDEIEIYSRNGFLHFEEIQLFVRDISADRVSDIACSFLMSFLVDFTIQSCADNGIPTSTVTLESVYDYRSNAFKTEQVNLPVHPNDQSPIVLVPKRWLRFGTWLSFDDYYKNHCPQDEAHNPGQKPEPVRVLRYNREHYDAVRGYVEQKERSADDCKNDPLFSQIPITSAKRKLGSIKRLPTGKTDNADRQYEEGIGQLMASLLYPDLDFAQEQSRTESGVLIRDLIFYNNKSLDFLSEIYNDYSSRQLVFELKNVAAVEREHINQLNRYLAGGFGGFGVLVTRHPLPKAVFRNTIDLWSGQRRCIIAITDEDLEVMVEVFETKQRSPVEVLKRKYIEFRRACPS